MVRSRTSRTLCFSATSNKDKTGEKTRGRQRTKTPEVKTTQGDSKKDHDLHTAKGDEKRGTP